MCIYWSSEEVVLKTLDEKKYLVTCTHFGLPLMSNICLASLISHNERDLEHYLFHYTDTCTRRTIRSYGYKHGLDHSYILVRLWRALDLDQTGDTCIIKTNTCSF